MSPRQPTDAKIQHLRERKYTHKFEILERRGMNLAIRSRLSSKEKCLRWASSVKHAWLRSITLKRASFRDQRREQGNQK